MGHKKEIDVAAALIFNGKKLLITKRPKGSHLEGMWEFPGGKQEPHETLPSCLEREIREELGVDIIVDRPILTVQHEYESRIIILHFFECSILRGSPKGLDGQEIMWIAPADLHGYTFPPPDKKILEYLSLREATEQS